MFKKVIGQDQDEVAASAHSETPAPQAPSSESSYSSSRSGSSTRNILSSDVDIKGNVKFTDDLVVDGKIEGEIISSGNLTIGENARIKAEINTGTIVVYGKIHGNLTGAQRIDIKSSAEVVGDIKTAVLSIEAGAIFVGKSTVGAVAPQETAPEPEPEPEPEVIEEEPEAELVEEEEQGTLAGTETDR